MAVRRSHLRTATTRVRQPRCRRRRRSRPAGRSCHRGERLSCARLGFRSRKDSRRGGSPKSSGPRDPGFAKRSASCRLSFAGLVRGRDLMRRGLAPECPISAQTPLAGLTPPKPSISLVMKGSPVRVRASALSEPLETASFVGCQSGRERGVSTRSPFVSTPPGRGRVPPSPKRQE
jgi:hypothetical protein